MNSKLVRTLINRLKEPSTWAGLSGLGIIFGMSSEVFEIYGQIIGGIASLLAIYLREKDKQ